MTIPRILSALALVLACAQSSAAQTPEDFCPTPPKTLFQWNRAALVPGPADAEPERDTLVTDRPDFTEASSTVGLGTIQLEAGYTFTTDDDGTRVEREHSWGEPLLRMGILAEWMELRVGLFPITATTNTGGSETSDSGTEDLYLGFKFALTEQSCWLPETAVITQMTVPTGSSAFSNNSTLPGVNYLYSWSLTDLWSMAGSTQFNRALDDAGKEYTEWAQSFTVGRSLGENMGMYNEFFALMPNNAISALPEYYYNGGFTYLLSDNVQWDIRAGVGMNDAAADFFAGTGLSIRYR